MATSAPLRVGYVPEHFSTPLHYATTRFSHPASLVPFPSGTGAMISALRAGDIDAGIGLTEGWIAGLGTQASGPSAGGYSLVGTYVETPLCWAISTGAERADVADVAKLKGKKLGVSRIGSGSYVMGFVLADERGWLGEGGKPRGSTATAGGSREGGPSSGGVGPFAEIVPLQTFAALREAVNDGRADFFMWEHFTSKRYYAGERAEEAHRTDAAHASTAARTLIRKVGEIYTPWPSWHIVATDPEDSRLPDFFGALNDGVEYFVSHPEENVEYISTALDYTTEDAKEWLKTVTFAKDVKGVRMSVVEDTVKVLRKAGVLVGSEEEGKGMVGIERT